MLARFALWTALLAAPSLVAPALADLPEPAPNTGATHVEVHGTQVAAEAWAVAKGHVVEAVVVARLVPQDGAEPKVETYERWSVDGRKKSERGDRKLGREWEKKLWEIVAEAEKGLDAQARKALPGKGKDLLGRLARGLGQGGSRVVDGSVVAWSIGVGESAKIGERSVARTAVIGLSGPIPEDALTPRDDVPPERDGVVTPGDGASPHGRLPRAGGGSGSTSASAGGSGHVEVSSERGARDHVRVEIDLQRLRTAPPPRDTPGGETTPSEK